MTIANNPLRQYFRRPSIYIRLPSGGQGYNPEIIEMPESGELPIFPMTAIDEITIRTPDALFNGSAICELIKSCVPNIKDPWKIQSIDLDAILIAIKSAAQGNEFTIESVCPSCEELAEYNVNLIGMLQQLKQGDYSKELMIGDLSVKFRPLIYKEMNEAGMNQFEIQKLFANLENIPEEERAGKTQEAIKRVTGITMQILAKTIEYIKTPSMTVTEQPFILDFLENCDKNVYIEVRDYHAKLKEGTDLKPQRIKCIHCQHEYDQNVVINATDFFG
jgi:hypothetical protein